MNKYALWILPLLAGCAILLLYSTNSITALNGHVPLQWRSNGIESISDNIVHKGKNLSYT